MTHPIVSFFVALRVVAASWRAGRAPFLYGSPGIGKSALVADLAHERELPLVVLIGSTMDGADVGIPVVAADGSIARRPGDAGLQRAAREPVVLFLDELSTAPADVQAALLDVILSRRLPDGSRLHEGTLVVAAGNPPDECPAGQVLPAALINRFAAYHLIPEVGEVVAYFQGLGDDATEADNAALADHALAFSALVDHNADLLQLSPPAASINDGAQWASPRGWECGLRVLAALDVADLDAADAQGVQYTALAGCVGEHAATSYLALRALATEFPAVAEIAKAPDTCRLPETLDTQIGLLGLIHRVADHDPYAAAVYAARAESEVRAAALRALTRRMRGANSPWRAQALRAYNAEMAATAQRRARRGA